MRKKTLPPRLYLDPTKRVWLIRDRSYTKRTGCFEHEREQAEKALAEYIALKHTLPEETKRADRITIAQVLAAYASEHLPETASPVSTAYTLGIVGRWWGRKLISEISKQTCKEFEHHRMSGKRPVQIGTVRRDLSILKASLNFWNKHYGPINSLPVVHLPPASPPRTRWLTRKEAARLLAGALGWLWRNDRWERDLQRKNEHLARFILLGLYTGSRRGVLLSVQWHANDSAGYIDLDQAIMYRKNENEVETKKRKPPVKLGRKIIGHLRRWARMDQQARDRIQKLAGTQNKVEAYITVVNWHGDEVSDIRHVWKQAREAVGLDSKVTPHTLRHTRATWLMQQGVDIWEASHSLGMSTKTLESVYGHHHVNFQTNAAEV